MYNQEPYPSAKSSRAVVFFLFIGAIFVIWMMSQSSEGSILPAVATQGLPITGGGQNIGPGGNTGGANPFTDFISVTATPTALPAGIDPVNVVFQPTPDAPATQTAVYGEWQATATAYANNANATQVQLEVMISQATQQSAVYKVTEAAMFNQAQQDLLQKAYTQTAIARAVEEQQNQHDYEMAKPWIQLAAVFMGGVAVLVSAIAFLVWMNMIARRRG